MCGIAGVMVNKEVFIDSEDIAFKMQRSLLHRGPDDQGIYISSGKKVCLSHTRLSIIDLSPLARQPLSNEDGSIWIVYNGEVYNFKEIREILINKDHKFKSNSDTEVILHAYEEWSFDCLEKLRGMFAFAIWDEKRKIIFIARDRLGIKPLYIIRMKIFSSLLQR